MGGAPRAGAWSKSATTPRWAEGASLPDWLALREGTRPLVLVAPHGGRRARSIRRGDSVNDLFTAEIAWELAERLDAHAIVNHGLDRNEIDLNRITHLAERAPGVLALLRAAIGAASFRGEVPLVLFVHGWNMVVPCCDLGIGLRRRAGEINGRFPTLSRERFETTFAAIEEELRARDVSSAVGRRYTASGRDNAAQLFNGRHASHENADVAALASLALEDGVDAAQLELGIPLRWEGRLRDAFVDGLIAGLRRDSTREAPPASLAASADVPGRTSGWDIAARTSEEAPVPSPEPGCSFQAVLDADTGVATFCGVESTGPRSMAARFSLVFTDGTMMLLVGEGEWSGERGHYALEGFDWRATDERIEITLRAPMIRYPTHEAYLDLESGLAGSSLEDADIHLVASRLSDEHAKLRGRVTTLGRTWDIDSTAFLDRGGRRTTTVEARIRVVAARANGDLLLERSRVGEDGTIAMDESVGALGTIRAFALTPLREAEVLARVPVWRPIGDGTLVRWTFGLVRCRFDDGEEVVGLFDCTDVYR